MVIQQKEMLSNSELSLAGSGWTGTPHCPHLFGLPEGNTLQVECKLCPRRRWRNNNYPSDTQGQWATPWGGRGKESRREQVLWPLLVVTVTKDSVLSQTLPSEDPDAGWCMGQAG